MKTMLICAMVCLGLGFAPASAERIGAVLDDGTVAGERQALAHLKAHEPEVYQKLSAMPPVKMRSSYGRYFYWFESSDERDSHERLEMVRQIKDHLRISELSLWLGSAGSQEEKDRIKAEMEKAAADFFESDLSLMEYQVAEMEKKSSDLRRDIESIKDYVAKRREAKQSIIQQKLWELQADAAIGEGKAAACDEFDPCYNGAGLLAKNGDCFGAVQSFSRAAEYLSNDPHAWYSRALLREALGDKAGGKADRARALSVAAGHPNYMKETSVADGDFLCKDAPKAGRSLYFDCRDHGSCMRAGENLVKLGDCAAAVEAYGKASRHMPKDPWAWYYGSIIRRELDDKAGSDADYARALALESGNEAFKNRGKPPGGGRPDFVSVYGPRLFCTDAPKKLGRIECDMSTCYNMLDKLLQAGDCSGEVEALTRGLQYRKHSPWAWYHRAAIRMELGDQEGAYADYARALAVGARDYDFQQRRKPDDGSWPDYSFQFGTKMPRCAK